MAIRGRRQPFSPIIRSSQKYAAPVAPPIGVRVVIRGAFAAQQAALFAHRPLFPIGITSAVVIPAPLPLPTTARFFPFLSRVQWKEDEQRLDRFTSVVSEAFNSLGGQGWLRKVGQEQWQVAGSAGITATRDPSSGDDVTRGYAPGMVWVRTDTEAAWVCVKATTGAAVWKLIS